MIFSGIFKLIFLFLFFLFFFSFYKMGTGNRIPIRWFDPVIDRNLPALADVVAEYAADMQIDATRIYIDRE